MSKGNKINPELEEWKALSDKVTFSGLLLGNGASRSVSEKFHYSSLYQKACELDETIRLSEEDKSLFNHFGTHNFEAILSALAISRSVNSALGLDTEAIADRYKSIRNSLISAVHSNHEGWENIEAETFLSIKAELRKYQSVYSTNYDLLVYWSIMHEGSEGFLDYFWSSTFDISDVQIWNTGTTVLYLHGGLHLSRTLEGGTIKNRADESSNLLDKFGHGDGANTTPLLIAEGNPEEKKQSIYKSDYLSFAISKLSQHRGPLCIFGHSLEPEDAHVIEAINNSEVAIIALSVYVEEETEIVKQKARMHECFPAKTLRFFRAQSHPMGSPSLKTTQAKTNEVP